MPLLRDSAIPLLNQVVDKPQTKGEKAWIPVFAGMTSSNVKLATQVFAPPPVTPAKAGVHAFLSQWPADPVLPYVYMASLGRAVITLYTGASAPGWSPSTRRVAKPLGLAVSSTWRYNLFR